MISTFNSSIARWFDMLEKQINKLAKTVSSRPFQLISISYIGTMLFNPRAKYLADYLDEIEKNVILLKVEAKHQHTEQVEFLSDRLIRQIAALQNEITYEAQKIENSSSKNNTQPTDLHQNLSRHQEYKRRLKEMINNQQNRLHQQENFSGRQKLEKELAILAGRLNRCDIAIKRLEKSIDKK